MNIFLSYVHTCNGFTKNYNFAIMQQSCIIEFDGAAKKNPGPAGAGAVLRTGNGNLVGILWVGNSLLFATIIHQLSNTFCTDL